MKKYLGIAVACTAMFLGSCGKADFESSAQKQEIFDQYLCKDGVESGVIHGNMYAMEYYTNKSASKEDRQAAADIMLADPDTVKNTWEFYKKDPSSTPMASERLDPLEDGICEGWTWEKYKADHADEIEQFTYEMAVEAGLIKK